MNQTKGASRQDEQREKIRRRMERIKYKLIIISGKLR